MIVTFLGTASGGGPSDSRNCSSLVCDILADKSLWSEPYSFNQHSTISYQDIVVDCAEGTTRQFQLQPASNKPRLNLNRITKIFITHMHGDSLDPKISPLLFITFSQLIISWVSFLSCATFSSLQTLLMHHRIIQ